MSSRDTFNVASIPKRIHVLFTMPWASQNRFTNYLRCSWRLREDSFTIYGDLGMIKPIRLLFTTFWASQGRFACYLKVGSPANYGALGITKPIRLPFTEILASQSRSTCYLQCSGQLRAEPLAIYCVLGTSGTSHLLFIAFWAPQGRFASY